MLGIAEVSPALLHEVYGAGIVLIDQRHVYHLVCIGGGVRIPAQLRNS